MVPAEKMTEVIAHFRKEHDYRIQIGAVLYLPDRDQTAEVVSVDFYALKGEKKRKRVVLVWESNCVVCGEPYRFETRRKFEYITRTCKAHRGTRLTPRSETRATKPAPGPRFGKTENIILEVLQAMQLVDDTVRVVDVLDEVVRRMPVPAGRDTRKFTASRALTSLSKREVVVQDGALLRLK